MWSGFAYFLERHLSFLHNFCLIYLGRKVLAIITAGIQLWKDAMGNFRPKKIPAAKKAGKTLSAVLKGARELTSTAIVIIWSRWETHCLLASRLKYGPIPAFMCFWVGEFKIEPRSCTYLIEGEKGRLWSRLDLESNANFTFFPSVAEKGRKNVIHLVRLLWIP